MFLQFLVFYSDFRIIRKHLSVKDYYRHYIVDFIYYVRHKAGNGLLNSIALLSGEIENKGFRSGDIRGYEIATYKGLRQAVAERISHEEG